MIFFIKYIEKELLKDYDFKWLFALLKIVGGLPVRVDMSEVAETLNHLEKQSEKLPEGTTIRWKGLEAMLQWKKGR